MWEAIESNRRRSALFLVLLWLILALLGFLVGAAVHPQGGLWGVAGAMLLWAVLYLIAAFAGDQVVLMTAGAKKIQKADAPQLFNVVEEMTIASGLGRMPDVYLIPDESPNAFAAGRSPEKRVVAVTSGLLRLMNRDELQGVVAHEMGHHKNADVRFMILAGVMLGVIILIAELFVRGTRFGGRGRSSGRRGGGGHPAILLVALLFAILAPVIARLLYFACSRRREYLADASAARFTRYPDGLACALEKISGHYTARRDTSRMLAPLYIVNPMQALAAMGLFSTHPPVENRVRILRGMGGGAGYAAYDAAHRKIVGGAVIGRRTLGEDSPVAARAAEKPAETREEKIERAKEAADLLGRVAQLVTMACACGVTIRVPESFTRDRVDCPRCGKANPVPTAQAPAPAPEAAPAAGQVLVYQRQGTGWESFRCACGRAIQISPVFAASHASCDACQRKIEVRPARA
jgi:heat shock protein HtpX